MPTSVSTDWRGSLLARGSQLGGIGLAYGLVGLACLAFGLIRFPPSAEVLPDLAITTLLIALACTFPFPIGRIQTCIGFIPALILAYGPNPNGLPWALLVGTALGTALDLGSRPTGDPMGVAFAWGWTRNALTQAVPAVVLMLLSQSLTSPLQAIRMPPSLLPQAWSWVLFVGMFVFAHWLLLPVGTQRTLRPSEWAGLGGLASIPLPYAALAGAAFAEWGTVALVIFGGAPAGLSAILRSQILTQRDLERRLAELSSVGKVSQVIQTSLDKETVLNAIFHQVSTLMGVDNFYLALLDEATQRLTYPLAVKNGLRERWPDRPLVDRLTDRVIRSRTPILIPRDAAHALRAMGMPEEGNPPEAWLGVPLVTSGDTLVAWQSSITTPVGPCRTPIWKLCRLWPVRPPRRSPMQNSSSRRAPGRRVWRRSIG